ncbi:MAG: CotH kinase family protein [Myxococcota bacterium]
MRIPPTGDSKAGDGSLFRWVRRPVRPALGLIALLLYGAFAFAGGVASFDLLRPTLRDLSGAPTPLRAISAVAVAPGNYLRALVGEVGVERISVDIGFKHLHTLHEKRAEAIESGVLRSSSSDYVPAHITHREKTVTVKVRFEGGAPDQFAGEKWPLRIAVKKGDHLFGMRRLTLRAPSTRGYQTERFFLEHLRQEGVLAPRNRFVKVRINGDDIGLMALEEHFAKELLESQQRRESVILRFDPALYWESISSRGQYGPFDGYLRARIRPFLSGKVSRSSRLSADKRIATGLLRGFVDGTLPASEAFDIETMARFLAVSEIWQSQQALRWHRLRFYYNPITARLEPIGFDGNLADRHPGPGLVAQSQPFSRALLQDEALRTAFVAALRGVAGDLVEGNLIDRLRKFEREDLAVLHREYPFRAPFDFERALARAERLRNVDLGSFGLASPSTGKERKRTDDPPLTRSPVPRVSLSEALERHRYLIHDADSETLVVRPGTWKVVGSLVLPEGIGLRMTAGTTLRFDRGEGLIAKGPLRFEGRSGAPVRLVGPEGDDPRDLWSGVAVLGSNRPSHWTHVQVLRTGGFERQGWSLQGGVVFRRSDVVMESCRLEGNRAEDALNIVRSHFELIDLSIDDASSDAFDADFSEGRVEGGRFSRIGGDGIDVSGSTVTLSGVHLEEIRDKAVSVGEGSTLTAVGLTIAKSGTAFVSKDRSHAEIRDSKISEIAHTALMAYVKKSEYGPAELEASGNDVTRVQRVAISQAGSRVIIDGKIVPEEDVDIDRLYKEGYMRQ